MAWSKNELNGCM